MVNGMQAHSLFHNPDHPNDEENECGHDAEEHHASWVCIARRGHMSKQHQLWELGFSDRKWRRAAVHAAKAKFGPETGHRDLSRSRTWSPIAIG
jgi:hypothetical protein